MTEETSSLDAGARAALDSAKPLITVGPPAAWTLTPIFGALPRDETPGLHVLVLAPEPGDLLEAARMIRRLPGIEPVHAVTGNSRAARLLSAGAVRTLLSTPRDALKLLERSALPSKQLHTVVVLWPEVTLALGESATLDSVLQEIKVPRTVFATTDDAPLKDFLERHARRAPLVPLGRVPSSPMGGIRYIVVEDDRRGGAVRGTLDSLNPEKTLLWEPAADRYERWHELVEDPTVVVSGTVPTDKRFDLAIAADFPTPEILIRLSNQANQVVVLARGAQLTYLGRVAKPLRALRLTGAADRARERAHALRQAVRERVEQGDVSAELLALAPLFDEYDPALVAAALVRGAEGPPAEVAAAANSWVRIQISIGKRDRVRPADIVGALLNGVGLAKDHVGRVEIQDNFSVVDVNPDAANRVVSELPKLTVRGRPLTGRVL